MSGESSESASLEKKGKCCRGLKSDEICSSCLGRFAFDKKRPRRSCAPQDFTEPLIPPDNPKDGDWDPRTGDGPSRSNKERPVKATAKGLSSISTHSPLTTPRGSPFSSQPLTPPSDTDELLPAIQLQDRKRKHSDEPTSSAVKRQEIDASSTAGYREQRPLLGRDDDQIGLIQGQISSLTDELENVMGHLPTISYIQTCNTELSDGQRQLRTRLDAVDKRMDKFEEDMEVVGEFDARIDSRFAECEKGLKKHQRNQSDCDKTLASHSALLFNLESSVVKKPALAELQAQYTTLNTKTTSYQTQIYDLHDKLKTRITSDEVATLVERGLERRRRDEDLPAGESFSNMEAKLATNIKTSLEPIHNDISSLTDVVGGCARNVVVERLIDEAEQAGKAIKELKSLVKCVEVNAADGKTTITAINHELGKLGSRYGGMFETLTHIANAAVSRAMEGLQNANTNAHRETSSNQSLNGLANKIFDLNTQMLDIKKLRTDSDNMRRDVEEIKKSRQDSEKTTNDLGNKDKALISDNDLEALKQQMAKDKANYEKRLFDMQAAWGARISALESSQQTAAANNSTTPIQAEGPVQTVLNKQVLRIDNHGRRIKKLEEASGTADIDKRIKGHLVAHVNTIKELKADTARVQSTFEALTSSIARSESRTQSRIDESSLKLTTYIDEHTSNLANDISSLRSLSKTSQEALKKDLQDEIKTKLEGSKVAIKHLVDTKIAELETPFTTMCTEEAEDTRTFARGQIDALKQRIDQVELARTFKENVQKKIGALEKGIFDGGLATAALEDAQTSSKSDFDTVKKDIRTQFATLAKRADEGELATTTCRAIQTSAKAELDSFKQTTKDQLEDLEKRINEDEMPIAAIVEAAQNSTKQEISAFREDIRGRLESLEKCSLKEEVQTQLEGLEKRVNECELARPTALEAIRTWAATEIGSFKQDILLRLEALKKSYDEVELARSVAVEAVQCSLKEEFGSSMQVIQSHLEALEKHIDVVKPRILASGPDLPFNAEPQDFVPVADDELNTVVGELQYQCATERIKREDLEMSIRNIRRNFETFRNDVPGMIKQQLNDKIAELNTEIAAIRNSANDHFTGLESSVRTDIETIQDTVTGMVQRKVDGWRSELEGEISGIRIYTEHQVKAIRATLDLKIADTKSCTEKYCDENTSKVSAIAEAIQESTARRIEKLQLGRFAPPSLNVSQPSPTMRNENTANIQGPGQGSNHPNQGVPVTASTTMFNNSPVPQRTASEPQLNQANFALTLQNMVLTNPNLSLQELALQNELHLQQLQQQWKNKQNLRQVLQQQLQNQERQKQHHQQMDRRISIPLTGQLQAQIHPQRQQQQPQQQQLSTNQQFMMQSPTGQAFLHPDATSSGQQTAQVLGPQQQQTRRTSAQSPSIQSFPRPIAPSPTQLIAQNLGQQQMNQNLCYNGQTQPIPPRPLQSPVQAQLQSLPAGVPRLGSSAQPIELSEEQAQPASEVRSESLFPHGFS